jgi:hypothetical protein
MADTIPIKEPVIIKAVVNGLIATSIIWIFWTPFLIGVGAPIMNAIIKGELCYRSYDIPKFLSKLDPKAYIIYEDNLPNPPTVAKNMVSENKKQFITENIQIFILLVITAIAIIYSSLSFANYLINKYGLNRMEIIKFNIVMAIIIIFIEIVFFATITTQYIPFTMSEVLEKISIKLRNEFSPLANS